MWTDEIVEETRQARSSTPRNFNYDLEAIYRDLKKHEEQSPEKFVSLPSTARAHPASKGVVKHRRTSIRFVAEFSMSRMPWSPIPRKPASPRLIGDAGMDFRAF
jgi:hypothetical protein